MSIATTLARWALPFVVVVVFLGRAPGDKYNDLGVPIFAIGPSG